MKAVKVGAVILCTALFLCSCNSPYGNGVDDKKEIVSPTEPVQTESLTQYQYTSVYESPDYKEYTSTTPTGTYLRIEGRIISQSEKEGYYYAVVQQEDENRWCVGYKAVNEINALNGKKVRVYGQYQGFDNEFNLPVIMINSTDDLKLNTVRIEIKKNTSWVRAIDSNGYIEGTLDEVKTEEEKSNAVVYEDEYIKVEYNGIKYNDFTGGYDIIVTVENLTDHSMTVQVRETSINGYMVDPTYSSDIASGKKSKHGISIYSEDAKEHPMSDIENVETKFHCYNYDADWRLDTEPVVLYQK